MEFTPDINNTDTVRRNTQYSRKPILRGDSRLSLYLKKKVDPKDSVSISERDKKIRGNIGR